MNECSFIMNEHSFPVKLSCQGERSRGAVSCDGPVDEDLVWGQGSRSGDRSLAIAIHRGNAGTEVVTLASVARSRCATRWFHQPEEIHVRG